MGYCLEKDRFFVDDELWSVRCVFLGWENEMECRFVGEKVNVSKWLRKIEEFLRCGMVWCDGKVKYVFWRGKRGELVWEEWGKQLEFDFGE